MNNTESFAEFFDRAGWFIDVDENWAYRTTRNQGDIKIWAVSGNLVVSPCISCTCDTYDQVLEYANELANTKVFGGWKE